VAEDREGDKKVAQSVERPLVRILQIVVDLAHLICIRRSKTVFFWSIAAE
jgi:hypothetical protein